jgi:hypothetical protein
MNRVARWLVVLTALLATSAGMDTHLHCEVPSGDNVNVLGRQNNARGLACADTGCSCQS